MTTLRDMIAKCKRCGHKPDLEMVCRGGSLMWQIKCICGRPTVLGRWSGEVVSSWDALNQKLAK